MQTITRSILAAVGLLLIASPTVAESRATAVILEHTERQSITSKKIGQRYELLVSLPDDYATSKRTYPVLYVLDGWHFPLLAFLQNNNAFSKRMPPVIIVNISHDAKDVMAARARDFTPSSSARLAGSGGASHFLEFLEKEIIPLVDRTYRTDVTDRALLGHSFGGLFAIYALEQRPGLFKRIVAASPIIGWEDRLLFSSERLEIANVPVRLDLSAGEEENAVKEDVAAFAKRLDELQLSKIKYRVTIYPNENHNSVRLASFPAGLYWVYRDK